MLFVVSAGRFQKGFAGRQKKKASRFINVREASYIRKMIDHTYAPCGNTRVEALTELSFVLGFRQAERALTLLPFAAFLEELDAFEALQDGTLAAYGTGCFEAGMLGHDLVVS